MVWCRLVLIGKPLLYLKCTSGLWITRRHAITSTYRTLSVPSGSKVLYSRWRAEISQESNILEIVATNCARDRHPGEGFTYHLSIFLV